MGTLIRLSDQEISGSQLVVYSQFMYMQNRTSSMLYGFNLNVFEVQVKQSDLINHQVVRSIASKTACIIEFLNSYLI